MKLQRVQNEIEKTKSKISDLQNRLKELENQKTEIENNNILAVVRSANLSQQELIDFIHAFKSQGAAAETMLTGSTEQEDFDDDQED